MVLVKTLEEIQWIRESARINALAHEAIYPFLQVGVTTRELDACIAKTLEQYGAKSPFPDAYGFPGHSCLSVNDQVGHGVPSDNVIKLGDVLKVDIGVVKDGYHSDCARTYVIGEQGTLSTEQADASRTNGSHKDDSRTNEIQADDSRTDPRHHIIKYYQARLATLQALASGIKQAQVGQRISNISAAIKSTTDMHGLSIVRHAFGHGIGHQLHEDPQIANFGPANRGIRLQPGMVFAIEPVVTTGSRHTRKLPDGWTEVTCDGSIGYHFEDTVLITEGGPEILTRLPENQLRTGAGKGVRFRGMVESDKPQMIEVAKSEMNDVLLRAWGRPVNPGELFDIPGSETIVLETVQKEFVGFYTFVKTRFHIHLCTVVIAPRHQGEGYGKTVMCRLEEMAAREHLPAVELWVQSTNRRALDFYVRRGYQITGTPRVNTLSMRKTIRKH